MIVAKGEGAYVSGIWHWIFCPWSSSQCLQRRKVWSNLTSSAIWLHKHADSTESIIFSFSLSVFSITVKGQIRMKKSIYLGHRLISCLRVLVNMSKWISKNIFFLHSMIWPVFEFCFNWKKFCHPRKFMTTELQGESNEFGNILKLGQGLVHLHRPLKKTPSK